MRHRVFSLGFNGMAPVWSPLLVFTAIITVGAGALFPRESATREVKLLNGRWNFRLSQRLNPNEGFNGTWWKQDLSKVRQAC